jgi:curli production assembly/transport component CsgF
MFFRLKATFVYFLFLAGLQFWVVLPVAATEMVYAPINPTFGGNPNNAPGLMSIAQAQNGFKAPALTPLETFNKNLEAAILSRLTSQAMTSLFGNRSNNTFSVLQTHSYDTLSFTIDVVVDNVQKSATITTTDKTTGSVTSFVVDTALQNPLAQQ